MIPVHPADTAMSDTPPPDLPDPASPTPETVRPVTAPTAVPGGKRIRSVPTPGRAARLPGTYAANYGSEDMSWRRGVGWLWTLFLLAGAAELLRAAFYMLAGHAGWPLTYEAVRVGLAAAVFVTLWLGWGWSRWLLVVADFLFGAWVIIMVVAGHMAQHSPDAVLSGRLPAADSTIETLPRLVLGLVCLTTAGYLAFSADVVDFLRHRREEGRGWVVLPVAALAAGYVALVCLAQVPYWFYLGVEGIPANTFGKRVVRVMTARWNPDDLASLGDEDFLKFWPDATRKNVLGSLAPLGELKDVNKTVTKLVGTTVDATESGFVLAYDCDCERIDFTHGHAHFNLYLTKHPFGAWHLDNFTVSEIKVDPAPAPGGGGTGPEPRAALSVGTAGDSYWRAGPVARRGRTARPSRRGVGRAWGKCGRDRWAAGVGGRAASCGRQAKQPCRRHPGRPGRPSKAGSVRRSSAR